MDCLTLPSDRPYTRSMPQSALKPTSGVTDPFYWGSRLQRVELAGRGSRLVEIPLTREDLLDPQEGDMMVHGPLHGLFIRTLADMLDRRLDAEDVAVFDDVKMLWGQPGVPDVVPDISVIQGNPRQVARPRELFGRGGRCPAQPGDRGDLAALP